MTDLPEPPEENDGSSYLMNLPQHLELNEIAYGNLPVFAGDFFWRRNLVHDLYHSLRSQGDVHDDAVSGVLKALPHIYLDEAGEPFFE